MPAASSSTVANAARWLATAVGAGTAICLWGVGTEALYFRFLFSGIFLLVDAFIVTIMESVFLWPTAAIDDRVSSLCLCCSAAVKALACIDTYKRSILYILLSVPCFVHYRVLWLPVVPGMMLLLTAVIYACRHCIEERDSEVKKIPSFVRFEDEVGTNPDLTQQPRLSQQSFDSQQSGGMGSKDSGIEASKRDSEQAGAQSDRLSDAQSVKQGKMSGSRFGRSAAGAAASSSRRADKQCLLSDDENDWNE